MLEMLVVEDRVEGAMVNTTLGVGVWMCRVVGAMLAAIAWKWGVNRLGWE